MTPPVYRLVKKSFVAKLVPSERLEFYIYLETFKKEKAKVLSVQFYQKTI